MASMLRRAAVFVTAGALLLTGSPAQAQGTWTVVPSPNEPGNNMLLGADASGAGQVWAVGRVINRDRITFQSRVFQHDGTAWRPSTLSGFPGNDSLAAVDAVSATEAWAAGFSRERFGRSSTLVARWNGSRWAPEPTPNGIPTSYNELFGVAATTGTVWAVGTSTEPAPTYNRRALILQRANGAWRVSPTPRVHGSEFLRAVDATGPADAWAVGWGSTSITSGPAVPVALRWNGTAWRSMPPPATASTTLTAVEALSPSNVWVVGSTLANGYERQPYVAQFTGTSWRRVPTPAVAGDAELTDVVALSPTNIIAVGTARGGWQSVVLHWNGSSWTQEAASNAKITGAAVVGPNRYWAVGARFELNAYEERTFTMVRT
jgi:hypothetical protein